jgi:hypothetical protein
MWWINLALRGYVPAESFATGSRLMGVAKSLWKMHSTVRVSTDRSPTDIHARSREKTQFVNISRPNHRERSLSALPNAVQHVEKFASALPIPPPLQSVEAPSPTNHSDPKSWDAQPLHSASPRDIASHSFVDPDCPRSQLDEASTPMYWAAVCAGMYRRMSRSISACNNCSCPTAMFQRPFLTQTLVRLISCQTAGRRDKILSNPQRSSGATRM